MSRFYIIGGSVEKQQQNQQNQQQKQQQQLQVDTITDATLTEFESNGQNGGSVYKQKYLKYKQKYLNLKNELEKRKQKN